MKRKIFRVEQKTGKLPDVAWKVVFEREIDLITGSVIDNSDSSKLGIYASTESVLSSLRYLFPGEQYRIILIVE